MLIDCRACPSDSNGVISPTCPMQCANVDPNTNPFTINSTCPACDSECKVISKNICRCRAGLIRDIISGLCVPCPEGFYADTLTDTCLQCDSACPFCDGPLITDCCD